MVILRKAERRQGMVKDIMSCLSRLQESLCSVNGIQGSVLQINLWTTGKEEDSLQKGYLDWSCVLSLCLFFCVYIMSSVQKFQGASSAWVASLQVSKGGSPKTEVSSFKNLDAFADLLWPLMSLVSCTWLLCRKPPALRARNGYIAHCHMRLYGNTLLLSPWMLGHCLNK